MCGPNFEPDKRSKDILYLLNALGFQIFIWIYHIKILNKNMSRSQSAIFRLIPHIQHIAHISHDTGRNISVSLVEKKHVVPLFSSKLSSCSSLSSCTKIRSACMIVLSDSINNQHSCQCQNNQSL